MKNTVWWTSLALIAMTQACVTSGTHDKALADLASTRAELEASHSDTERVSGELATAHKDLGALRGENATQEEALASRTKELAACRTEADSQRLRLQDLGAIVTKVSSSQKSCQRALSGATELLDKTSTESKLLRDRLARLRAVEEEQRRRNEIYRDFVERFRTMIDAGELTVVVEGGRIVIKLPEDILFESGKAEVSDDGRATLAKIAAGLASFKDRRFQVEGHTDNVPIRGARYASNWELSSSRSLAVVHLLLGAGVAPENLSAAGYGEFQPRAPNDSKENKALNRRIAIVMLPNLDILSSEVPQL
jgi:chemotaxis protein MotB